MSDLEVSKKIVKTKTEEYLDIDEKLVELEKDKDIIRLEMNIVELPLFSKDTKRKKNDQKTYYFKHDKSSFVEIEPPDGYAIPGEFEERVFIALTKIMRNKNYEKRFIVTANEILESLGVTNKIYYSKLKTALYSLSQTNYRFNNSLYSSAIKGIINDVIYTHIMDIRIITRKNEDYKDHDLFEDNRIKELYQITFTEDFYNNIITTGYLAFDSELLLQIESSIARAIYTILEKWRNYELYLKRPVFYLARRIPLKWDKRQLKRTVSIVESALEELKGFSLIKDFNIIKNKKWDLAEVEIFFTEEHNKVKKSTFFSERADFNSMELYITSTEEKSKNLDEEVVDVSGIINMFPEKIKLMKTFEPFIQDEIKKHGLEYVKYTCEYVLMKNPKTSLKSYLAQALEKNWADEYIAGKKVKEQKTVIEEPKDLIEEAIIVNKYTFDDFLEYSEELQAKITNNVYTSFLKEADSVDNKTMRGIFEKSKKALIVKYINENEVIEETPRAPIGEKLENEIINEYVSKSKFLVEVLKIAKDRNIEFDIKNVAPVFNELYEYEDEEISINYDETTKIGKIQIIGGTK